MTEQLKPCPFCGAGTTTINSVTGTQFGGVEFVKEERGGVVVCGTCGANGSWEETPDEAVEAWNTRAVDEQINGLMQTIESQNQTAQAMGKKLQEKDACILEAGKKMAEAIETFNGFGMYGDADPLIEALAAWRKAGEE